MPPITILVVDDHRPFRRFVRLALQGRDEFQIVGEASDGVEAVERTVELQPDLVLLDIGLPKVNGIEVARQIRTLAPQSKILFLSQESSATLVRHALRSGARGYVQKASTQRELIPAIKAVMSGIWFVGSGLRHDEFVPGISRQAPHHHVQFYSDESVLIESFARYVAGALQAGDTAVVVATKPHREALIRRLTVEGFDVNGAIREMTYISLDAAEALPGFMKGDFPDPVRFFEATKNLVAVAELTKRKGHRVHACGEVAPLLWAEGNVEGAIQAENLLDQVVKTYDIDSLCAYPLNGFEGEQNQALFERLCAEHSSFSSR